LWWPYWNSQISQGRIYNILLQGLETGN